MFLMIRVGKSPILCMVVGRRTMLEYERRGNSKVQRQQRVSPYVSGMEQQLSA